MIEDMVAVITPSRLGQQVTRVVHINVITIKVATEDCLMDIWLAVVEVRVASGGKAAIETHAVYHTKMLAAVAHPQFVIRCGIVFPGSDPNVVDVRV